MLVLAGLALLALAYTYVGYPVVLLLLGRLRPKFAPTPTVAPPGSAAGRAPPRISVLLPAFNAEAFLAKKIESLLAQDYPPDRVEILIYCDGCTDDTERVARALASSAEAGGRIRVFVETARLGKPAGLNTLAAAATGDLLLLNDVRQPFSPGTLAAMARALGDPKVGCATGRLVLSGSAGSGVYWRYEEWLRRRESGFRGMVGMTGPIGMIRRADFAPVPADMILDDMWLPLRIVLQGKRVFLVPEAEAYDTAFEDDREFGRKVRTLAGNYQLFARLPRLLFPVANPIWFETISHKIMRLCAPWALVVAFGASAVAALGGIGSRSLVVGAARALLLGQLAFYGAAALGPKGGRLPGVARTFVVLNAAAIFGLGRFLTGRQRVTWTTGREVAAPVGDAGGQIPLDRR